MEYFLYCIRELSYLNKDILDFEEDIEHYKKRMAEKDKEIQKANINYNRTITEKKNDINKLQDDNQRYFNKIKEVDEEIKKKTRIIKTLIDHILGWRVK